MSNQARILELRQALDSVIVGQDVLLDRLVIGLLADGHVLVEGLPGLAKTTAVKTLAAAIHGGFRRIQFTPDLLPGDLTGTDIYHEGQFEFIEGPLFHEIILADEINRAPAKVQAALLEAMQEHQITVGGVTRPLPPLFMVMATQNPLEQAGTYPLPEAQLDRFLLHVALDYPSDAEELDILRRDRANATAGHPPVVAVVDAVTGAGGARGSAAGACVGRGGALHRYAGARHPCARRMAHGLGAGGGSGCQPARVSGAVARVGRAGLLARAGLCHAGRCARSGARLPAPSHHAQSRIASEKTRPRCLHRRSARRRAGAVMRMRAPLDRLKHWLRDRVRATQPEARLHAPLVAADDLAGLAEQASLLAHLPVREVHDHHAGDWASRWLGRGLDFEESRLYSPGDDIRDMDWRTTARTGRAHLKIYREERQPLVHLVIDRGATMRFGTRRRLKVAQGARVAALLAFAAVARNGVIGATLWDSADDTLPARHGRPAALALIERAAAPCPPLADPAPSESLRRTHSPQGEALRHADRLAALEASLPRGARLVLISDFTWLTAAHEPVLARLAARCDTWAIQIVDAVERALPDLGRVRFHDMTSGQRVWLDTAKPAVRAASQAALLRRLDSQAAALARAGVRHLRLDSEADDLLARLVHG